MRVSPDLALCSDFFFFLFNQQITLTTITGSNVKKTLNTELLSSQTGGGKKKLQTALLKKLKWVCTKALTSQVLNSHQFLHEETTRARTSHTHTSYTHYTHGTRTHTYSIVYRLTHMSQETAVIPSAIKKKTGRLTNGSTHTPNTLFITHHLHKQTHTHMHARTLFLSQPTHCSLAATSGGWGFFLSLSLSLRCSCDTVWLRLAVSAEKAPAPKILPLTNSSDYSLTFSLSPSLPPVFNQHVNKRKVIFFS